MVFDVLQKDNGGLIAVDAAGNVALPFNSEGMTAAPRTGMGGSRWRSSEGIARGWWGRGARRGSQVQGATVLTQRAFDLVTRLSSDRW